MIAAPAALVFRTDGRSSLDEPLSANRIRPSRPGRAWGAVLAALACASAAATPATDERAQYRKELAACTEGRSNQDRATCLKEANAAFAQARHGTLVVGASDYARNASLRCKDLQGSDGDDCRARMQGQGGTSGSVAGGGVLRELVTDGPVRPGSAAAAVDLPQPAAPPSNRP